MNSWIVIVEQKLNVTRKVLLDQRSGYDANMTKRISIGVVVSADQDPTDYLAAVLRAGGEPKEMVLPDLDWVKMDGLLMAAGPKSHVIEEPETLDKAISCVSNALDHDLPILAIADGFLSFNRAAGGSFVELIDHAEDPDKEGSSSYHRIYITPGGKLAATIGSGGFVRVNSRHSLGIREAQKAEGLLATAYSLEDGLIEALESPDHKWAIGVQFSPERRMEIPPHFDRLFEALVIKAAGN